MALARYRRDGGMNYWPGFVDALSTLILSIIFLLTVFMVAQFFLSQEISGKDTALQNLNAKILQLSQLLSLEQTGKTTLQDEVAQLRASLTAVQSERDRLRGAASAAPSDSQGGGAGAADAVNAKLDLEKAATARAIAQIENLSEQIKALRTQIGALEQALGASEQKQKDSQLRIADLGQRLNVALAQRVQELSRYRSDFFGKLRDILGNRPDIRVVGDRFVFQSEVFFDSGQAALRPEGKAELDQLATALSDLEKQIPSEINWVLRVDGHTDTRPLGPTSPFKSNWELSAARAISVVQYLIGKGVPPQRLVAAGFGEFQPIDPGTTDEAFSRNRRIELKLTER
jgi:chemotaxis protein MotB